MGEREGSRSVGADREGRNGGGVRWYYSTVGWLGWNEVNWCMRLSGADEYGEGLRGGGRG